MAKPRYIRKLPFPGDAPLSSQAEEVPARRRRQEHRRSWDVSGEQRQRYQHDGRRQKCEQAEVHGALPLLRLSLHQAS